jgi:hypothetical protein
MNGYEIRLTILQTAVDILMNEYNVKTGVIDRIYNSNSKYLHIKDSNHFKTLISEFNAPSNAEIIRLANSLYEDFIEKK